MMRRRVAARALLAVLPATLVMVHSVPAYAAPTPCSYNYDWAQQWVGTSSAFYHPGSGCPYGSTRYTGYSGLAGNLQTPAHYPSIASGGIHSLGWFNLDTCPAGQTIGGQYCGSYGSWIQEGWVAGCIAKSACGTCPGSDSSHTWLCTSSSDGIHLYEEGDAPPGDLSNYTVLDIGGLSYSSTIYLTIEWYPNPAPLYPDCAGWQGGGCWVSIYNGNKEAYWHTGGTPNSADDFKTSGGPVVGSEISSTYNSSGDPIVEMPTTVYGSSDPSTTGLRIKGANGYVSWNTSLPSGYTMLYDERNCPDSGQNPVCPNSPKPTYISNFYNYYKVEGCDSC